MATVTSFTAARMLAMEADTIIDGNVVGDNLILIKKDSSTVDAGSVRGPVGPQGPDGNPTGTIIMGGWAVAPSGYLLLNGATVVGGTATYAALAAMYPSWVVGPNLVLPDTAGVVPLGGATPGVVSGSMTHTLVEANLPSHTHSISAHTHPVPSHTHTTPDHSHAGPSHTHGVNINSAGMGYELVYRIATGGAGFWTGRDTDGDGNFDSSNGAYVVTGMHVDYIGDHAHNVSGNTGSSGTGSTGGASDGNTTSGTSLTTSNNTSALVTGSGAGTGTAINHTPKNLTVRYAVKT
jgi:microcystin-dependent protein